MQSKRSSAPGTWQVRSLLVDIEGFESKNLFRVEHGLAVYRPRASISSWTQLWASPTVATLSTAWRS